MKFTSSDIPPPPETVEMRTTRSVGLNITPYGIPEGMMHAHRQAILNAVNARLDHTPKMHNAVRAVLKHHGLTEIGDTVVEADLIAAVLKAI